MCSPQKKKEKKKITLVMGVCLKTVWYVVGTQLSLRLVDTGFYLGMDILRASLQQ